MDFELEFNAFMLEEILYMLLTKNACSIVFLESILSNEYAKNIQVFYLYQVTNKNVHRMLPAKAL